MLSRNLWSVAPLESHEGERVGVLIVRWLTAVLDVRPLCRVKFRESDISRHVGVHVCQVDPPGERQHQSIDLRAADRDQLIARARLRQRLFHRMDCDHALRIPAAVARQYEIDASRQRPADGFECLAAHEDRLAERESPEALEVVGQPPGERVVAADDTVLGHGDDQRDQRLPGAHGAGLLQGSARQSQMSLYGGARVLASWRRRRCQISTAVLRITTSRNGIRKNSAACVLYCCMRANSRRCSPRSPVSGRARTTWRPTKNELSSVNTRRPRARQALSDSATSGVSMKPKRAVT